MSSVGEIQAGRLTVSKGIPETVAFPEDLALARRAALQEEAAWREIYDVTRDRLFALLSYYTGQREEALELLQETYLGAIRSIDRYRGDGSLMSWLAIIAIRRARDWRRKLVQWKRTREALVAEQSNDPAPIPDEHVRLKVRGAISELKGHQRGAFLMRELEGMSFREIGDALGCDEATARVHYFRARQTMKNLLEPDETRDEGSIRTASRLRAVNPTSPSRETDDEEARS